MEWQLSQVARRPQADRPILVPVVLSRNHLEKVLRSQSMPELIEQAKNSSSPVGGRGWLSGPLTLGPARVRVLPVARNHRTAEGAIDEAYDAEGRAGLTPVHGRP
jgi:hypothetical protein